MRLDEYIKRKNDRRNDGRRGLIFIL